MENIYKIYYTKDFTLMLMRKQLFYAPLRLKTPLYEGLYAHVDA